MCAPVCCVPVAGNMRNCGKSRWDKPETEGLNDTLYGETYGNAVYQSPMGVGTGMGMGMGIACGCASRPWQHYAHVKTM